MKSKRLFGIKIMLLLFCTSVIFQFLPEPAISTDEYPTEKFRHAQVEDNVFLGNEKLELGINEYGAFGSTQNAPTGFNPWDGAENKIGLRSSPWDATQDYFLPGTVDEGMILCFKQDTSSYQAIVKSSGKGVVTKTNISTDNVTTDTSTADKLQATTTWSLANYPDLKFSQVVTGEAESGVVRMTITLTNNSANELTNLEYYRGFDPDQASGAVTNNYYYVDEDDAVWIVASTNDEPVGESTFEEFTDDATSPFIFYAPASTEYTVTPMHQNVGWSSKSSFAKVTDTSATYKLGSSVYSDHGIGLLFEVASLPAGESIEISYSMSLDSDIKSALETLAKGNISKQPLSFVIEENTELDLALDLETLLPEGADVNDYTFQWQSSNESESGYSDIDGVTNQNYLAPTDTAGTKYYRCVIKKNGEDEILYSGVTRVTVFEAETAPVYYTVKFDKNLSLGTITNFPPTQTIENNNLSIEPSDPVSISYDFLGWSEAVDSTEYFDFSKEITDNVKLYAQWSAKALTGTTTIDNTSPKFGDILTATLENTNNTGTLSYEWKRGDIIVGTNSNTYEIVEADIGSKITVKITSDIQTGEKNSDETDLADKADGATIVSLPELDSKTHNSITVKTVTNQQYKILPDGEWQDSGVFNNLTAETEYNIVTQIKSTNTTEQSAISSALSVTTNPIPTHTITATAGANGSISPSGDVIVTEGNDQEFTFTPNEHYEIDTVTVDGETVTIANGKYTIEDVTDDMAINVTFKGIYHTITATAGANGTISTCGSIFDGDDQEFTFTPNAHYEIDTVTVDGSAVTIADGKYTIENVTDDMAINVTFKGIYHTITATAGDNGTISTCGSIFDGDDQEFTFTPNEHYEIDTVTVDGSAVTIADGKYTIENVTDDMAINVTFKGIYHTITATAGANGSISTCGSIFDGDDQEFTFTPDAHYEIDTVTVDGETVTIADGKYTITNVTDDMSINVTFKGIYHTITATAGDNGTISTCDSIFDGDDQKFTFTPNEHYEIGKVTVDGTEVEVTSDSYTIENITKDMEIDVQFTLIPKAEGDEKTILVETDKDVTFKINADFDRFKCLLLNDEIVSTDNYTAVEGSIIITLKGDYVKTLDVGTHNFIAVVGDHSVNLDLIVEDVKIPVIDDTENPNTQLINNYIFIPIIALIIVASVYVYEKKRKANQK